MVIEPMSENRFLQDRVLANGTVQMSIDTLAEGSGENSFSKVAELYIAKNASYREKQIEALRDRIKHLTESLENTSIHN